MVYFYVYFCILQFPGQRQAMLSDRKQNLLWKGSTCRVSQAPARCLSWTSLGEMKNLRQGLDRASMYEWNHPTSCEWPPIASGYSGALLTCLGSARSKCHVAEVWGG